MHRCDSSVTCCKSNSELAPVQYSKQSKVGFANGTVLS